MSDHPWFAEPIRLLHKGEFKASEKMLRTPPKDVDPNMCKVVLMEVLIATARIDEARALYETILWQPPLPWYREKTGRYASYFVHTWSPRVYSLHPMETVPETMRLVGGSICAYKGGIGVLARAVNMTGEKELKAAGDKWGRIENTLYWCVLDPTFRMLQSIKVCDRAVYPRATDAFIGYEDPRIVAWKDGVWITATSYQLYRHGKPHVVLGRLDDRGDITKVVSLQCPDMNDDQKHWTPWVHKSNLHVVYRLVPWTVLRIDDADTGATSLVTQRPVLPWDETRVVAGTSPVPYKDGYVMAVAISEVGEDGVERFLHRFVRIAASSLLPTHYSSTWVLWKPEWERIHGLYIQGDYVYLSCGHDQNECRVTRITVSVLETCISWYSVT